MLVAPDTNCPLVRDLFGRQIDILDSALVSENKDISRVSRTCEETTTHQPKQRIVNLELWSHGDEAEGGAIYVRNVPDTVKVRKPAHP